MTIGEIATYLWIIGTPFAVFAALVEQRIEELTQNDDNDPQFWSIAWLAVLVWPIVLIAYIIKMIITPIGRGITLQADKVALLVLKTTDNGRNLLLKASEKPEDAETIEMRRQAEIELMNRDDNPYRYSPAVNLNPGPPPNIGQRPTR